MAFSLANQPSSLSPVIKSGATDSATYEIDWLGSTGRINNFQLTLNEDITLSFSNGIDGYRYILVLIQDNPGARLVTWDSKIVFGTPGDPVLTVTADSSDILEFIYDATTDKYQGVIYALGY